MEQDDFVPSFITQATRFGIDLSLDRMKELMSRLNNPHKKCKYLHVAGTNGKGSVVAYLSTILACAGYNVGVYTSPYIEHFSERIRVLEGKESAEILRMDSSHGEISASKLCYYSEQVENAVKEMQDDSFEHPTEFELVTAIAFLFFADTCCDYVVLETGLGGRFDATNIIENPVCSVITSIGYDHMDCLGDSIEKIAFEKAGIIKKRCPVYLADQTVSGLSKDDVLSVKRVIKEKCISLESTFFDVKNQNINLLHNDISGQTFELNGFPVKLFTRMHGMHQLINASLAVEVLSEWVSPQDIAQGIRQTFWKARNEVISKQPLVIIDGAHNPQSMACFAQTSSRLMTINQSSQCRLIIGMLKDKDVYTTILELLKYFTKDFVEILCVTPDHCRAMPAEELAVICKGVIENKGLFYNPSLSRYNVQSIVRASENIYEDCANVYNSSLKDNLPIVCTGSLYLVGQVRSFFIQKIKETQI